VDSYYSSWGCWGTHALLRTGNANNDWQVTVNLINESGTVQPPAELPKVTAEWEALYQGLLALCSLPSSSAPLILEKLSIDS
jgi:hypothetical protein